MQVDTQKEKSIIIYNDFLPRLFFSIGAAHFIVNHGERYSFGECLLMPTYYYSLAGSSVIAITIMQLIYFTTCRLDRSFGWEKDFLQRLTYQLLFGVLTQVAIALIGAAIYFYLFGLDIKNTRYIKFILPNIVFLILLFNLYYALHYFVRLYNYPPHLKTEIISLEGGASPIVFSARSAPEIFLDSEVSGFAKIEEPQTTIPVSIPEIWNDQDILMLYILNSVTYVVMRDGSSVVWADNIKKSMKHLPPKKYFKIRSSVVVKRETIAEVKKVNSITYVILNFPFKHELVVSARNLAAFKKWFKE